MVSDDAAPLTLAGEQLGLLLDAAWAAVRWAQIGEPDCAGSLAHDDAQDDRAIAPDGEAVLGHPAVCRGGGERLVVPFDTDQVDVVPVGAEDVVESADAPVDQDIVAQ